MTLSSLHWVVNWPVFTINISSSTTVCAQYKIAVLTFIVLQDSAPRHPGPFVAVADLRGQQVPAA